MMSPDPLNPSPLSPSVKFFCSEASYEESDVVILGVPLDTTTVYRPGTRFGPLKIREMSYALETYSFWLQRDLKEMKVFDFGNNYTPFEPVYSLDDEIDKIYREVKRIIGDGKKIIALGGSHLISYPVVKAISDLNDISVVHFDAHADLVDRYNGEKLSHATVMRRVSDMIGIENLYQFGIRSGTEEEYKYARNVYPDLKELKKTFSGLEGDVYISIDIDCFDPAFAPGTGTPEPGGLSPSEFFREFYEIYNTVVKKGSSNFRVVGFDVVEVSPPYDNSDITSILAARIVRDFILMFF